MKIWRKKNFKDFHNLSIEYTVSNFKVLIFKRHAIFIFKRHAIFIEASCVTFREQKEPTNTKVLGKDRTQKNHCKL